MELDYYLATTLLKLLFLVILVFDVWRLFLSLPKEGLVWSISTSSSAELTRHSLNTLMFSMALLWLLVTDISYEHGLVAVMLDLALLLIVFTYLLKPRTFAIFDDKSLWLDGFRLAPERVLGLEDESEERPGKLMVLTQWRGIALRKRVLLADEAEVVAALAAFTGNDNSPANITDSAD